MTADPVVILLVEASAINRTEPAALAHEGRYVAHFDPAGTTPDEVLRTTDDPTEALPFVSMTEAFQFYRQRHGTRPDGRPNRPLTAYTAVFIPMSKAIGP